MTDAQYEAKFQEMQKYIPFLQKVIEKLKVNNVQQADNPRKAQLQKMEMLHDLLTNKAKKLKMETLMKCEGVLIKLYAKIEKQSTFLQNEDSILNNVKLRDSDNPSTSKSIDVVEDTSGPASPPPENILNEEDQPVVIPTERRCSPVTIKEKSTNVLSKTQQHHGRQTPDHRKHHHHGVGQQQQQQKHQQQHYSDKHKSAEHFQNIRERVFSSHHQHGQRREHNISNEKHQHQNSPKDFHNTNNIQQNPKDSHSPTQPNLKPVIGQHISASTSASSAAAQRLQTVKVVITEPLPQHIKQQHFQSYRLHQTSPNMKPLTACHNNLKTLSQTSQHNRVEPAREVNEVYSPEELWEEYNESTGKNSTNKNTNTVFSRLGDKVLEKTAPIAIPGRYTPIPDVLKSPPLSASDINNLLLESRVDKTPSDVSEVGSRRPQKLDDKPEQKLDPPTSSLDFIRLKLAQITKLSSPKSETPASPSLERQSNAKEAKLSSPLPNERVALKFNPHPRQERLLSISSNDGSECSNQSRLNDPRLKSKLHATNPLQKADYLPNTNVNVLPSINFKDPRLKLQGTGSPLLSTTAGQTLLTTYNQTCAMASSNPTSSLYGGRKDPRISRVPPTQPPNYPAASVRRLSTTQPHYSSEENWDSEPDDTTPNTLRNEVVSNLPRIDNKVKTRTVEVPIPLRIDPRLASTTDSFNRPVAKMIPPTKAAPSYNRPVAKMVPPTKAAPNQTLTKSENQTKNKPAGDLLRPRPPKSDAEVDWDVLSGKNSKPTTKCDNQTEAQLSVKPLQKPSQFKTTNTCGKSQNPFRNPMPPTKNKSKSDTEEDWDAEPETEVTKEVPPQFHVNNSPIIPQLISPCQNKISPNPFANSMQRFSNTNAPNTPNTPIAPPHNISPHPFVISPHSQTNYYTPPMLHSADHNRFSAAINDNSERIKYYEAKKQKAPTPPTTYKAYREAREKAQAQEAARRRAVQFEEARKRAEAEKLLKQKEATDAPKVQQPEPEPETNQKTAESTTTTQKKPQTPPQKPIAPVKTNQLKKDNIKVPAAESSLDKMYRTQNFNSKFPKANTTFKIPKKKTEEDNKKKLEEEEKKKLEEETKKKLEEETKKKLEEETKKKLEDETKKKEAALKKTTDLEKSTAEKLTEKSDNKKTLGLKITGHGTNSKSEITAGQNIIQTKNTIAKGIKGKPDQEGKQEETISQENKTNKEEQTTQLDKLSTEISKSSRDPRCRPKTNTAANKDTDKTETKVNDDSPELTDIVITSFETEVTLKPQTTKATGISLSLEEKNKAALEKFNKATQEMSPKPQKITRRRNTMLLFGSAPIVDKEKLLNANALLFEDIQEQEKRKRKKEEEDRQNARRSRHLEEMFQRTDDNCTVSTQNIITGKRRTRATINFNETVVAMNVFRHTSKKDSLSGNTTTATTASPSPAAAAAAPQTTKTTKNTSKAKTKSSSDNKTKSTETEDEHGNEESKTEEIKKNNNKNIETKLSKANKETKVNNSLQLKDCIKSEYSKDKKDLEASNETDDKPENEPSTSKTIIKPGKKKAVANRKSTKDIATIPEPLQDDEHQNCAVSSTSAEAPAEEQPKASCSRKTYKTEPDDNEPTSTASKINNPTPTPEANIDVLNDIVQQIIKPNADRQHILGLLGQILSEDRLEFIKTIIDNTTKQQTDPDAEANKSKDPVEESDKSLNKDEQNEDEPEEEEKEDLKPSVSLKTAKRQGRPKSLNVKKKRNELDRLNEDIRDMFICEGVLTATGRRMCTIIGQTNSNSNDVSEATNKKSPKETSSPLEITAAKRKVAKANVEKPSNKKSTPLRRSLRGCRTNEEGDHDDIAEVSSLKSTTESNEDQNSTTDSNTTDSTPRRKMPLLKPNTPIKLPEEENSTKEVANEKPPTVNKRKQFNNKPCPKSKKPKNVQNIQEEEDTRYSETESEMETNTSETQEQSQAASNKDDSLKTRNTNIHWHNQSKYVNWCVVCEKRIPAKTSAFHYNSHHGENFISRLAPVLLQKFKQGKLNQPLFGVDRSPKQASWFFRCPFCLQYLNTTMPLWLEHLQNHTAEFRYECSRCHRGNNKALIIRKHISNQCKGATVINSVVKLTVPTMIKAHVCHLCNFMQLKRVNLERHYLEQHQLDKKNVDLLGYTITLFDVENVTCVPEDKAAGKEAEVRKVIDAEEQVIDILDDDEDNAKVNGKEKTSEQVNDPATQKEKPVEGLETEEDITLNSAKESLEKSIEVLVKKEKPAKQKELTTKVSEIPKENQLEKVATALEVQNVQSIQSEKDAAVTKPPKENSDQSEKDAAAEKPPKENSNQSEKDAAVAKPPKENSNQNEQDATVTKTQEENNEDSKEETTNKQTEKALELLNLQKKCTVLVVDIRKEKTKSTNVNVLEEPSVAADESLKEKEKPAAKEIQVVEILKEKEQTTYEILKPDDKGKNKAKTKKDHEEKLKLAKESSIIDLVIIEDGEAQDIQDELLVLAAQAAAQEEEQTNQESLMKNPTEIQSQIMEDDIAKTHNELFELASEVTQEQKNLTLKQTDATKPPVEAITTAPNPDTLPSTSCPDQNTFAQETHATISDLISSSIDRIYQRGKRKSSDVDTVEAKKSCKSKQLASSNVFMSTRDENNSSPTIQILAQSIINIEEEAKQNESPSHKPFTISIAERLSQRFKGFQDKATAPQKSTTTVPVQEPQEPHEQKKPRENPFEKLFNDTVLELEKEKDKIEAITQKETIKETPQPPSTTSNEITVISDDEDWEDIEITESAPTTSSSTNSGNLQKSKNKGLFQKFGLYKANNTKNKKIPPLVFLPTKKKTKEKSSLSNTTTSSSSPTPSIKSTTSANEKSQASLTTTNANINLGFKPVINIMDDLLPDSPCNDPIDLVPELATFEPLQDLNDVSSILDSNLSVIESVASINVQDHHTSMEDALDFISEQQAQDKQTSQTQSKVITNNIAHVGYSVQSSGAYAFKFYCLLENCSFLYSSDALGLENHFMCEHSHIKWNGYCLMCQTQCLPNDDASTQYSITKEIQHMLEKHANKTQLDLHTESTQHSTTSSHESEDKPKIKLRRLTGDCLSTANSDNSTSLDVPPLTMLGALLNAKQKPPTKEMPPQPQMPLTEPLLLDKNDVGPTTTTPFKNVSQDFLITSVTSAALQQNDSPLQIANIISLKQSPPEPAATSSNIPKITNVRTLASTVGNLWSQQIVDERQELMESAAESLEVSQILANAGRPSTSREPVRILDDSPGPVVVAETVPVAQGKTGDYVITQTISAQYNENSSAAVGFNISIASATATSTQSCQESIPTDVSTPITSRQYKCMASSCKFVSRVPVAMSDHLRFHERRNLSNNRDYFACAFCSYLASSVDDYMKHSDQYHIINKAPPTAASETVDTASSLTRKIHDILNRNKSMSGGNSRTASGSAQNPKLPEQDTEEVYLRKLRQTIEEIVEPTGLTDDKLYRCVVKNCATKLTEAKFLSHIMFHIGSEGGNPNNYNFKCPHCSAQYHRVAGIKAHIKNHAVNRFFCYLCQQTCANPAQLLKHFSEKHWHSLSMFTKVLLQPKVSNDGSDEVLDSGFFVAYTQEMSDDGVRKFGEKLILEWQRKKSGSKTHFKSTESDLLPLEPIFQRVVNCGECEYSTKVRTNMLRHLLMHKQHPDLANTSGQSKVASVDPVNPVPCLNSTERFFDKMANLSSSSLIPSLSSSAQANAKSNFTLGYSFVTNSKRFTCGCPNCSFIAISEDVFRQHMAVIHSETMSFRCTFCYEEVCKKGLAMDRILNHLRFHGAILHRCEECNYLHHMRYVVERHINEKHATLKVNLVTHERSSEDNSEGLTTKLAFTGKKYRDALDSNQQPQSSTSLTLTRSSNSDSSASKSTSSNLAKGKGKWICDLCGHKSTTLAQIQTHCQQQHGSKNQYKCFHCNFGSQQLFQILCHVDEKHAGKTRTGCCMYRKAVNGNDDVADTRPLWQRNDPTRVRHIRGILMEDEEESEEYRKKLGLTDDIDNDDEVEDDDEVTEELSVTKVDYLLGYEFSCFHCEYKTQNFNDLKTQHYQNVHNPAQEIALPFWYQIFRRLCCAVCRQFMGNFIEMKKHLLYVHNDNRYYAADLTIAESDDSSHRLLCGYCSFHCLTVEQLHRHSLRAQHLQQDLRIANDDHIMDILKLGQPEKSYQCTLCSDIYPSSVAIVQHACSAHPGEDSFSFRELTNSLIYRCFKCRFTKTSEIEVLRHMIDHFSRFTKCHFCPEHQNSFIAYMQHCYAEHRNDIRKFRELYPILELQKFLLNVLIVFPSGLMISKSHLLNTKYGKTLAIEELYEDIYKISQQPPIPRLLIGRLVARKSIEAQYKQASTSTSSPTLEPEVTELLKQPTQAQKISQRRCTVAISQNDKNNTAELAPQPKLKLLQKPQSISQRRQTVTVEHANNSNMSEFVIASGIENTQFNAPPILIEPKKISKRRRTVAVDFETPSHSSSPSPYPLLSVRELTTKKRKTSCGTPPVPVLPSNLDVEPFSYYGQTPEPIDMSKIFTKVAIAGIQTPLTIDKLKNFFNIDCQLKLTKCDQVETLTYKEYKHVSKACPASHKVRYN